MIDQAHLFLSLFSFFGVGILLAFTPCVLPMVPILSSILIGQGKIGTMRAFQLSLTFVLSMALTYAGAGMLAGYMGSTLQTALQLPWVIVSFSLVFVFMALSMFGVFNLSMPARIQNYLHQTSNHQKGGSIFSVAIMGFLSTLIASPCVTAPLVTVLTYISQTGNALLGGVVLFSLALGMGLPLLLFGVGQGALLPKSGVWMNKIKMIFGIMMLALAIWMLSRVLPGVITLFLWSALFIISAVGLGALEFNHDKKLPPMLHGISILGLLCGVLFLVGAASGHDNLFAPLSSPDVNTIDKKTMVPGDLFMRVNNMAELQKKLNRAKETKRPVLVEFYASWCPSCRALDADVLSDVTIQKHLQNFMAIRIDITNKNPELLKLMEYFHVFGTPTLVFYDSAGNSVDNAEFNEGITIQSLDQMLIKLS